MELSNYTFDELTEGQSKQLSYVLSEQEIKLFAAASGDVNPIHLDAEYAAQTRFKQRIGHGMWLGAKISAILGNTFPGPGTIYLEQEIAFKRPVFLNDEVDVVLTVQEKSEDSRKPIVVLECIATNQKEEIVAVGTATVLAPKEKAKIEAPELPSVEMA